MNKLKPERFTVGQIVWSWSGVYVVDAEGYSKYEYQWVQFQVAEIEARSYVFTEYPTKRNHPGFEKVSFKAANGYYFSDEGLERHKKARADEDWVYKNKYLISARVNCGATADQLREVAKILGMELPE